VRCYVAKSFRDSTISAKEQQMAQWLNIVSWIAVILGLLTALVIAFDVTAHPQHMKIMNVVWPILARFAQKVGRLQLLLLQNRRRPQPCDAKLTIDRIANSRDDLGRTIQTLSRYLRRDRVRQRWFTRKTY
jgi:hypothetical protein